MLTYFRLLKTQGDPLENFILHPIETILFTVFITLLIADILNVIYKNVKKNIDSHENKDEKKRELHIEKVKEFVHHATTKAVSIVSKRPQEEVGANRVLTPDIINIAFEIIQTQHDVDLTVYDSPGDPLTVIKFVTSCTHQILSHTNCTKDELGTPQENPA